MSVENRDVNGDYYFMNSPTLSEKRITIILIIQRKETKLLPKDI